MPYHSSNKKNAPPQNKAKTLTARQENALQKHEVHHTKKHMTVMRRLMREGKTFTESHKIAMKEVGK
jgi:hypothetical protein